MLSQLTIASFAIIDRLELSLSPGLNVLTGETGAGKSIVIDAVSSLLGGRLGVESIRTGEPQARVEAIFDLGPGPLADLLEEQDLLDDEGTLIVSRDLNRSGRSVARVNGRAVPLATLRQIGQHLIDVHGQSEHLSLMRVAEHVAFLDGFAGLLNERAEVARGVASLRQVRREIESLVRDERELARRTDLLRFQVDEIGAARLLPDEEDSLRRERHRLANAERLSAAADSAYRVLYEGAEGEEHTRSAIDLLGDAATHLADLGRLDPATEPLAKSLEEALYVLEDLARELRGYRDAIEYSPERLEAVEERLDQINRLKRKYGASVAEVLQFAERAAQELEGLGHREERLADLREREASQLSELGARLEALSAARRAAAEQLARAVERELADLSMQRTRFHVDLRRMEAPDGAPWSDGKTYWFDATGADRVEFMISTNPGEPLKPLARIASGGETSRLMLALKTILARADVVPVLIFDEIDVGIGGRAGYVVGQKLAALAAERQVICVTHLPQIACFADAHYRIAKETAGGSAVTRIALLNEPERIAELGVMLGGSESSDRARANARELLEIASQSKQALRTPSVAREAAATRPRREEE